MKTAIISVSDKTGIDTFAKDLQDLGFRIYSTGGTLKLLQEKKIQAESIKKLTQFPEILDGRVKTLHPHVHGGILADKSNTQHLDVCDEHNMALIDLVVVNLYPFEKTIQNPDATFEQAIENIDIGGPTMIRAAAKNFKSVGVISSPDYYKSVIKELKENKNELSVKTKQTLATVAFKQIAHYDTAIANYFLNKHTETPSNNTQNLPEILQPTLEKIADLRYGENPHQKAAIYTQSNSKLNGLNQLHGKELSYNNYLDIDSAINIAKAFQLPGAAIIKHTNPCGAAVSDSLATAYEKAYQADSLSAFGSIVGLNRTVDINTAEALSKTFIEVIVAPKFDDEALSILTKKANLRLIEAPMTADSSQAMSLSQVGNNILVQTLDDIQVSTDSVTCVTKTQPSQQELNDLIFSFSLVKFVKSNAILIGKNGQTLGIGAGQMSRVDSVEIALKKAGKKAKGAVLASDAFFPFKDSIQLCADYGISAIIQPGGSKRDQESIDCCNDNHISMVFTGSRHFKH